MFMIRWKITQKYNALHILNLSTLNISNALNLSTLNILNYYTFLKKAVLSILLILNVLDARASQ